ncbi:hypothetical protein DOT_5126 [Desulfosporosinus sp. OT]|nr:hypothetical protein DOT_5126 [Desulfosporosinus sp. OT]
MMKKSDYIMKDRFYYGFIAEIIGGFFSINRSNKFSPAGFTSHGPDALRQSVLVL